MDLTFIISAAMEAQSTPTDPPQAERDSVDQSALSNLPKLEHSSSVDGPVGDCRWTTDVPPRDASYPMGPPVYPVTGSRTSTRTLMKHSGGSNKSQGRGRTCHTLPSNDQQAQTALNVFGPASGPREAVAQPTDQTHSCPKLGKESDGDQSARAAELLRVRETRLAVGGVICMSKALRVWCCGDITPLMVTQRSVPRSEAPAHPSQNSTATSPHPSQA
jgi:hypothetical protein